MSECVNVVGAGLAGCEAAWQLSKRGIHVKLYEMKKVRKLPTQHLDTFAELVCSNSLRSNVLTNAVGLLKEELRHIDSLIMESADKNAVPAGSALAVDRNGFSQYIYDRLKQCENIEIIDAEVVDIPQGITILACGPMVDGALSDKIKELIDSDSFYFYDAVAPIVSHDSINMDIAYKKSRYDKGDSDYINCPFTKEQFDTFYQELIVAETVAVKDYEKEIYFEGCMPFEVMAKRGVKTLLFGPMKPVGLIDPRTNTKPYAVVQLRQDDAANSLYNIVGFQTHLTWPAQRHIISLIPGLENAKIMRYGVMHRNTYINSPTQLLPTYQFKRNPNLFFAGQISGVEGYIESCASGALAGINAALLAQNKQPVTVEPTCMIGAMANYITHANARHFVPMNANFGILQMDTTLPKNSQKEAACNTALQIVDKLNNI